MEPYTYHITLSDGSTVAVASPTPLNADDIREIQEKYNKELEAAKGGPLRVAGRTIMQTSGGLIKGATYTASGILDLIGASGAAAAFESAGDAGEDISAAGRSLAPESTTGKVLGAIGETGGMLVPMIAGGIASGGGSLPVSVPLLVGGGLGFSQKYGSRLSQLKKLETARLKQEFPDASEADLQIMARGQAMGSALQSAAQTGALTMLGGVASRAFGAGGGLDTGSIIRDLSAKGGKSALKVAAKGGLIEGLEEFTDEALDMYLIDRKRYYPELGHESATTRLASAFALGSFFGAGFSGLGAKAENIRANKELLQMTEDIKRIIGPKIEARWMKDAGLSDETITLLEQGRKGGIRPEWIEEGLQIKGKKTIRSREAIGRLRELEQIIEEDIRADYLTDPNSNLSKGERHILRKAGLEAEEEIVSLLIETDSASVEELVEGIKSGKKQILGAEMQTLMDETGSASVEELFRKMTAKPEPAPTGAIDAPTGAETLSVAPTSPIGISTPPVSEEVEQGDFLVREGGGERSYRGAGVEFVPRVRESRQIPQVTPRPEGSTGTRGPQYRPDIPALEGEVSAEEQAEAEAKMEAAAVAKGDKPEKFGPKGIVVRDFPEAAQALGVNAPLDVETGPTAVARAGPAVEVPDAPSSRAASLGRVLSGEVKPVVEEEPAPVILQERPLRVQFSKRIAADLDKLLRGPPKRNKTEEKAHRKKMAGEPLTKKENAILEKFEKKRKKWKAETKAEVPPLHEKAASEELFAVPAMEATNRELALIRKLEDNPDALLSSDELGTLASLQEKAGLPIEKPFKPTKGKLVKMRNAIRSWRKKQGGRMSALPFDTIAAQAVEHALSIAIKVLETTGSMKKALAEAYASLGETSISKKDFDSSMTGRMIDVLELVDDGTKYEDAVAATRAPLDGKVPFQIFESSAWSKGGVPLTLDEGETVEFAGPIETATPLPVREEEGLPDETVEPVPEGAIPYAAYKLRWGKNTGLKLWNSTKRFFVTNLSYGASDLAKRMGLTETLNTMYVTLGKQMDNQVDHRDKYMAQLRVMLFENGPAPYETASKKEKEVAEAEFEAYQKKLFYRKKDDPMPSTEGLSEVGKGVIDGWKKVAEFTGNEMVDARIRVRLPNGKYRDFKKIGETFWGRMMLPKYAHALNSLTPETEGITAELEEFGKILKKAKEIDRISVQNIRKWWWEETGKTGRGKKDRGAEAPSSQDANRAGAEQTAFFSGVDKARTKDKPLGEAMDFTLKGGGQWIYNWSNRMAQVNAYGQKTGGPRGQKDYFDTLIGKLEGEGFNNSDEEMQFVYRQRKSAYDLMEGTFAENLVALSGKVATLTMLTGYFNAIRNLTGWGPTAAVFGMSNSFKGMAKLVEYADAAKQSRAWGTLQNNAELLLAGQDISGGPTHALDKAVKWGLSKTMFTAAENTVRIHAGFTASAFVTEGIDAVKKENNPGLATEFKEMALRFDTDPDIIIREDNPMGEETSKFIRRAVKEVQGGYRFNQLPSWMQTNTGRFLNKFGSYGLQITRAIRRNALEPIMKDPTNIRKWLPLMRFIGTAAGNGELLYAIRDLIFGKERPDETLAEIVKGGTPMADLFWRMVNNMTYAGTLGIIGDFSGMARSVATKRRVRNPFEPAGAAVVSNSLLWINNAIREKKLSEGSFLEFLTNQFAFVRYLKPAAIQTAGRLGAEWDAVQLQDAKEDRNFLRNATRRFQEAVGDDVKNMIGAPTYARSPYTQYYSDVKDELMIGDVKDSREAALKFAEALDPEDRDGAWARLSNSVSASQPMKIGDARNKEIKMEFLSWARRNLSEADVERILKVQSTYMNTARNTGLISGGNEQVLRSMKILMNLKAPKGRKRSRKESTDPVRDALKRHKDFMEKALGR